MFRSLPFLIAQFLAVSTVALPLDAILLRKANANATEVQAVNTDSTLSPTLAYQRQEQTTSRRGSGRREVLGLNNGAIVEFYE